MEDFWDVLWLTDFTYVTHIIWTIMEIPQSYMNELFFCDLVKKLLRNVQRGHL